MDNKWNSSGKFPRVHKGILEKIQNTMASELQCEPEQFKGRIIFMSMYDDIDWSETTKKPFKQMLIESPTTLADFSEDIGHSWGLDVNKKWYGTHVNKLDGGSGRRYNASTSWTSTSRRRRLPRNGSSRLWQNRSWRDSKSFRPDSTRSQRSTMEQRRMSQTGT